jgi:hypothetical protein
MASALILLAWRGGKDRRTWLGLVDLLAKCVESVTLLVLPVRAQNLISNEY